MISHVLPEEALQLSPGGESSAPGVVEARRQEGGRLVLVPDVQLLAPDQEKEACAVMLFDPNRSWHSRGACQTEPPELFFPESSAPGQLPTERAKAAWAQAKEICKRCPVIEECHRDTLGEPFGVWGGRDEYERWHDRKKLPERARKWPAEQRLAWGKELDALRQNNVSWTRIREMTGISEHLGGELLTEWQEHARALYERDRVGVKPLPAADSRPLSFPPTPGDGHAWVRRAGLVSSALYRGETADGKWLLMHVYAGGRHKSHVWVPAEDVQLHTPQPVQILEYVRRPDVDRSAVAKTA